jgi:hypothetical protein
MRVLLRTEAGYKDGMVMHTTADTVLLEAREQVYQHVLSSWRQASSKLMVEEAGITPHLAGVSAFTCAQGQDIVKSIFMTIINRLPKGIKMSVKSLRALEMERGRAVLI